jgi:hypothetical protein
MLISSDFCIYSVTYPANQWRVTSNARKGQISTRAVSRMIRNIHFTTFEVFTAVEIQVEISWVVMPCNFVLGYQLFGGLRCLHLQAVTPCIVVVGYYRFGETCCVCLQVVILVSVVVGWQCFGRPCCLHVPPSAGSMAHWNVSIP